MMRLKPLLKLLFFFFVPLIQLSAQCDHFEKITYSVSQECQLPRYIKIHAKNAKSNVKFLILNGLDTVGLDSLVSIKLSSYQSYKFTIISKDSSCTDTNEVFYDLKRYRKSLALDQNSSFTKYPTFSKCIVGSVPDTFKLNLVLDSIALNWYIDWDDGTQIEKGDSLLKRSHLYTKLGVYNPRIFYKNGDCIDTILGKIFVERQPVAGIAFGSPLGSNQGCVPLKTQFVNTTKYRTTNMKFTWETGDGTKFETSSDTISHTYTKYLCDGVVKMTAKNNCGTSIATWNPIQASTEDQAVFNIINPSNCDTSKAYEFRPSWVDRYCTLPDVRSFKWIWGDGTSTNWTSSLNNVQKKFKYGEFTIKFLVRNGCGIDTSEYKLLVIDKPIAKIEKVYKDTGCAPYTVEFKTQSKSGENYSWSFGDGNGASGSIVKYTYRNANKWIVRLNVTNRCGNAQDYDTITVYRSAKPIFSVDNNSGCEPLSVKINNLTDASGTKDLKFRWSINDSFVSDSRNFNFTNKLNSNKWKITLTTQDFCNRDSMVSIIDVYKRPISNFDTGSFKKCVNDEFVIENKSQYSDSSIWITPEGVFRYLGSSSLKISFKNPGKKQIKLISKSVRGCLDTFTSTIWIRPSVDAYFYHDNNGGCGPIRIKFTSKSQSIDSFKWIFGKDQIIGRDTISYLFTGRSLFDTTYNVKLIGWSNGCRTDSFESDILLRGSPIASFKSDRDTFCFPEKVTFYNQSLRAIKFQWNLGQGLVLNSPNPQAYFPKNPNYLKDTSYQVVLTAFGDVSNCISRDTMNVVVKPYPIPRLVTNDLGGCSPYTAKFISKSTNSIQSFWDFGNGYTTTGDTVAHTFYNRGFRDTSFKVMLRVRNIDCYDSSVLNVSVYLNTQANFDFSRTGNCKTETWEFINKSINSSSWLWSFGDGNFSQLKSPSHQFVSSAYRDTSYIVKLVSYNDRGCVDSITRIVSVKQKLKVDILDTALFSCPPLTYKFVNKTKGASTFIWDFGDGSGSSLYNPTHTYTKTGEYRYKLIAFDINGCKDSITSLSKISIKERPKSIIYASSTEVKLPYTDVDFDDLSLRSDRVEWSFSDDFTTTQRNFRRQFLDSGNYKLRLISFNSGCSDTSYSIIRVNWFDPIIDVQYRNDTQCAPALYEFKNYSKYADKWTWYFGDGSGTSSEKSPKHIYDFGGNYRAILVAEGPGGKTVAYFNIKVLKSPTSSFDFTKSEYERLYFNWRGVPSNSSLWNVYNDWLVTDEDSIYFKSNAYEPLIKLNKSGKFTVILITRSEDGCLDSSEKQIELERLPKIFVPNAFTPNNDMNNQNFGVQLSNDRILVTDFELSIYNRWGEKVFQSFRIEDRWDGTYLNKECMMGVYAWKVKLNIQGTIINQTGTVTLIR